MDTQPKVWKWGILSVGNISNDFSMCLQHELVSSRGQIVACGSRSLERSQAFAKSFGIPKAYGSYKELAEDPEVEIVYIGSIHPFHKEHALLCMSNKKHVVIEKPIALNATEAMEIY